MLRGLTEAGVEFVIVGGSAAILGGAGRPKDRAVLPLLVAALDEQRRRDLSR
jgi:hypothetical protein